MRLPKKRGRHRLWTDGEDGWLRYHWGRADIATIAVELQRTIGAVCMRARALKLRRLTLSIPAFAHAHGYAVSRVRTAIRQKGMRIERVPRSDPRQKAKRGRCFMLSERQQSILLSYLRAHPRDRVLTRVKGAWGIGSKPPACAECGTTVRPHFAKGKCKPCYVRVWKWIASRSKNPSRRPKGDVPRSLLARHEQRT